MNLNHADLINSDFHDSSKVWIYQSSRIFSLSEALEIEVLLKQFASAWMSHGVPVKASGYLFYGQFIVLMADEEATGVSGCSTDSSVRFIKELEQRFRVSLFDRTTLAFLRNEKVELIPFSQFQYATANGLLTPDTPYFNNLVTTKKDLQNNWIIPISESWLMGRLEKTGS